MDQGDLKATMLEIAVAQIRYALESDDLTPALRTTLTTARSALNLARRGRGEVPVCASVQGSCHGDSDIDECVCLTRLLRECGFARVACPGCLGLPALGGDALSCPKCSDHGYVIVAVQT